MKPLDLTKFDFYALRFRQSETVQQMTAEEVGQYMLLMVEAWLAGKEASLPTNPKLLAIYARVPKVSDLVLSCWTERDGRLYNERLSEEYEAAKERALARHEKAKAGAKARYGKEDAQSIPEAFREDAPMPCHANAIPNHARPSHAMPLAAEPHTGNGSTRLHDEASSLGNGKGNGKTIPVIDDEDMVTGPVHNSPGQQATIFARLLYQALPQNKKDDAPAKWEELWAADMQGMIDAGESVEMIEKVLRALPRLARLKYVYRGESFVSRYNDLAKDVVKLGNKPSSSFLMDKIKKQEKEAKRLTDQEIGEL